MGAENSHISDQCLSESVLAYAVQQPTCRNGIPASASFILDFGSRRNPPVEIQDG